MCRGGLAQENDLAIVVSAQQARRLIVRGPGEIREVIGLEFGEAVAGSSVRGRNPQGRESVFAVRVAGGFAA
jgi:hypothetical protein